MTRSNARIRGQPRLASCTGHELSLSPMEMDAMEALWNASESRVRDVVERLGNNRAYTTVMTALDRLFKRGLLDRRKSKHGFVYSPHLSGQEWARQSTRYLVSEMLAGSQASRQALLSAVVDAVSQHGIVLLEELEKDIRRKRKELSRGSFPSAS